MNDIEYIKITIFNKYYITKINIDTKKLKVLINDEFRDITIDKINELLEITKYWKLNYQGLALDAEKFTIKLISNVQGIKTYQGNGEYPYNYNDFKRWTSDII